MTDIPRLTHITLTFREYVSKDSRTRETVNYWAENMIMTCECKGDWVIVAWMKSALKDKKVMHTQVKYPRSIIFSIQEHYDTDKENEDE